MIGNKNTETRLAIAALVFLVLFVLGNGCYRAVSHKSGLDKANRAGGEQIVRALEQYRKDKSVYPADLGLLKPAYLKDVPSVQVPEKRIYMLFSYTALEDGKHFTLAYPEAAIGMFPSDAAFEYDSRTAQWKHKMY
ncbi:MAG: hypothetical protein ACRD2Y_14185 [Terriglobales bacterium]